MGITMLESPLSPTPIATWGGGGGGATKKKKKKKKKKNYIDWDSATGDL